MARHNRIVFVFAALMLVVACEKAPENIPVTSVSLSQPTAEMIEGETIQLLATVLPSDATNKTVTWASSKQSVATVSNSGMVTAIAEGTSTITASAEGKSASCKVVVQKKVIPVSSVTLNRSSLTLTKGQSETLTATVNPADATNKAVAWSSSDSSVASVDQNGKVTAANSGTATITATSGDKSATCRVTVTIPVESIKLDPTSITCVEGETITIKATVNPSDATDKTVTWSSSDANVATVDQSGTVVAIKEGSTTITASAGGKSCTCQVDVQKKVIPVTSVTLNKPSLDLTKGQSETLTATVNPSDATEKTVTWASTNSIVASVDQNGKVQALNGGSATITAKAGDKTASCTVNVTVLVETVSIDPASIEIEEGQTEQLTATVNPSDASDKSVKWTSSNASIATVNDSGIVTAIHEGSAIITATAGDKSATCNLIVKKKVIPVTSISLNKSSLDLINGQSETLSATVNPSNATDKTVIWSSSDSNIASVDQNGKVTAVNPGKAIITAQAGDKSAICSVNVTIPVESITLNLDTKTIKVNEVLQLEATITPADASNRTVTWTSSNASVASVNESGLVKGLKEGSTTITASAEGKTATCTISVVGSKPGENEGIGYDE